ncbi:MAG TPA: DUF1361 domain-containing protein [Anaerolineales bacterium]|nr:DUF1361 domain-containing protein [Anaerolineales bacterium]
MYQRLQTRFAKNKYRLFIFAMLSGASVLSIALWRWRASVTGSINYAFLIWNLFLAWIPFIISYFTYTLTLKRSWLYILLPIAAFLWLIFFPNAPYILTDFQHLSRPAWQDIDTWYDVLMLMWFAFTGLLLGIVSLFMMQEIIRREFGRWIGWAFVLLVTISSSLGIYMGRFLRWNSWDILSHPANIALFALQRVQAPSAQSLVFTGIFAAFFLFLYITLYAFGHLLLERQANDIQQQP